MAADKVVGININSLSTYVSKRFRHGQLPLYRSRRDLYYLFDITKFRYGGSYINGLEVLGENIHLDVSGYFVISEFDIQRELTVYTCSRYWL